MKRARSSSVSPPRALSSRRKTWPATSEKTKVKKEKIDHGGSKPKVLSPSPKEASGSITKYFAPEKKVKDEKKHIKLEYENPDKAPHRKPGTAPSKWEEVWSKIAKMRSERVAPVDEHGCGGLRSPGDPKLWRYQILISLMLSAQTKDAMTMKGVNNLREAEGGLTPENISKMEEEDIDGLIRCVGYHRNKAKYIKKTSAICVSKYGGDVPKELDDILALPGVGPKMAYLLLQHAWGENKGIGVDVHVHRISNRLGWVSDTKTPEKTRKELESWLPSDRWAEVNGLLVGFGQTICNPVYPKCNDCLLKDGLCPSAFNFPHYHKEAAKNQKKNGKASTRGKKKEEYSDEDDSEEAPEDQDDDDGDLSEESKPIERSRKRAKHDVKSEKASSSS